MRAFLTGGAGFVARHLAEYLLSDGWHVTAMDDLSTGSMRNVNALRAHPRFTFVQGDVRSESLVAELVDDADVVFHLAAAVGVQLVVGEPVRTIEVNVHGTETVLRRAAKKGRRTLVFSTSEVYGKASKIPFVEDDDLVLGPSSKRRWAYACSKLVDEFLALAYHDEQGVPVTVVRFFNLAGPFQTGRYGMVIPRFVQQALTGEAITVYGTGEQTRCFCHVTDAIRATASLALHPETQGQVYNIGSPVEITINSLAESVKTRAKSASEIVHIPYDQAYAEGFEDAPRRVPCIDKIRQAIGWEPTRTLNAILDDVILQQRVCPDR